MTATSGKPATTESHTPSASRIQPPRRFAPAAFTTYSTPSRHSGRNGTGLAGAFVTQAIEPFSWNAIAAERPRRTASSAARAAARRSRARRRTRGRGGTTASRCEQRLEEREREEARGLDARRERHAEPVVEVPPRHVAVQPRDRRGVADGLGVVADVRVDVGLAGEEAGFGDGAEPGGLRMDGWYLTMPEDRREVREERDTDARTREQAALRDARRRLGVAVGAGPRADLGRRPGAMPSPARPRVDGHLGVSGGCHGSARCYGAGRTAAVSRPTRSAAP